MKYKMKISGKYLHKLKSFFSLALFFLPAAWNVVVMITRGPIVILKHEVTFRIDISAKYDKSKGEMELGSLTIAAKYPLLNFYCMREK